MYKFVAIDVDGTLLNSNGALTERITQTLNKVTNKGIRIVLTSGRVTNSVRMIAEKINADHYMICDNGASIYDISKDETVWSREIPKSFVYDFIEMCEQNNIYYMVFTDSEIIVKNLKHLALVFYKKRHNINDEANGITYFKYANLSYIKSIEKPIRRIVICDEDRSVYNAIIRKISTFEEVSLMSSPYVSNRIITENDRKIVFSYSYAEILPKGINKWTAIEELTKRLNITKEEVVAIGDNFNDVEMIQNAGLGIAMNNGASVAKSVARVIAPSNNEDGVAIALEQYVLKNSSYE